jgi:AbrB family looped-hinge helix DNA binding protein
MQKEVKVGKKGQVTIPKAMRKALKIEPGSTLRFTLDGGKITIEKVC